MELSELSELVDLYKEFRDKRLEYQKLEDKAKAKLLESLQREKVGGVAGRKYMAVLVPKTRLVAEDWSAIQHYITMTGDYDVMQRRLSEAHLKELVESTGELIPGVTEMPYDDISLTKL